MDITSSNMVNATRMFNQQQIQRTQASIAQQKLRQEVMQNSSPEGSSTMKPSSESSSIRSRYMFAIGDDGKRILRLQIDLTPSMLNVLA